MSFDDAGTFEITTPGQPVSPHTVISSTNFNALIQDMAAGISTAICRDGQSTVSANIPMNAKKFTGLAAGTARTDSASLANLQDGTGVYVATVGGTADAITLTPSPAITAYAAGQTFRFVASGTNTTAVTVAVSGLSGPKAITKNGATALVAGDIPSGAIVSITYDGTRFVMASPGLAYLPITGGTLTGNLLFTDGTYDIGASGATRPRDLFLQRNLTIGGALSVTGRVSGVAAFGGHLFGLTISNSGGDATNDIVVAIGTATSNDAAATDRKHMFLTSALTKQLDAAWAVGTAAGMLDTGSIANATYHIYLIMRTDTGVVDILASTSASSPTMPTNYDTKRRIGSIIRSGATILPFVQDGDFFQLNTPILDINATNPGTSAVTRTLTVPLGITVRACINAAINPHATNNTTLYLSALSSVDLSPSTSAAPLGQVYSNNGASVGAGAVVIRTNTSSQIRSRVNESDGSTIVKLATTGWFDRREQDA